MTVALIHNDSILFSIGLHTTSKELLIKKNQSNNGRKLHPPIINRLAKVYVVKTNNGNKNTKSDLIFTICYLKLDSGTGLLKPGVSGG